MANSLSLPPPLCLCVCVFLRGMFVYVTDEISLEKAQDNITTDVICFKAKQTHCPFTVTTKGMTSPVCVCLSISTCFLTLCTVGPALGPGIVSGDCC